MTISDKPAQESNMIGIERKVPGKVVLFGAGATGRGHVGLLAWQAGYDLVLVDRNPDLVACLQNSDGYLVRLYGRKNDLTTYAEIQVSGYRILHSNERDQIAQEIIDAELVLTAVFDQNLPDVAETLALAVQKCRQEGRSLPLNVIACENMMDSSSILGQHVYQHLAGTDLEYCQRIFGFPDCMISRVVPKPDPDPLVIVTEDYNEWTVRREAFKGVPLVKLDTMELVDNQTARLERKLFIHNGGHAVCGYMGFHRGHRFIHEAVADPVVLKFVGGALDELGAVIQHKHGFSSSSIDEYKRDLGRRGSVAELKDEVLRVVRDPIRKLSSHERLVAPALLAVEYRLPRHWIVRGIVAALRYRHQSDSQSIELGKMIEQEGLKEIIIKICSIPPDSPLLHEILVEWDGWNTTLV